MRTTFITLMLIAAPRLALACPVCFGDNNSSMTIAMRAGIWLMLGIVALVLGAFATFFIYLMRRARLAEQIGSEARPYASGQEGTAQC
jgi:hypothetical protein